MPQYERKTGYVVRRVQAYCFIAEVFDPDAQEQFFAHANAFKRFKVPNVGARVTGLVKRNNAKGKKDAMFDIEVVPTEATA